jgi:hypothetical protein
MKKLSFILLLTLINLSLSAQTNEKEWPEESKPTKIALSDLEGNWYSADSTSNKISFKKLNNYAVEMEGIRHGVGNYSFNIAGDSISVKGMAINWPPLDCSLRLLKGNLLEIEFFQFYYANSSKMIYRR